MNGKKLTALLLSFIIFFTGNIAVFAETDNEGLNFDVNSIGAYLVGDYETGVVLEEHNGEQAIEIASITKIMSYLIVMDQVKEGKISLSDRVEIDEEVARIGGSSLKLKTGEILTVEELLNGLLVVSANDATNALAKHCFSSEEAFVEQMSRKAHELNLNSALFYNCTGLPFIDYDGIKKQNMMSPKDIFTLARYIIDNYPEVVEISSKEELVMEERNFSQKNTNDLVGSLAGVDGLKTGYTDKAGYCLVSTAKSCYRDSDCRIIAIVMNAKSVNHRSNVSRELIEYTLNKYEKKDLLRVDKPVQAIHMPKVDGDYLKIYPKESYRELVSKDENLDMSIELKDKLKPSFMKGDKVGEATIYKEDEEIKKIDLIIAEDVYKNTFFDKIVGRLRSFFRNKFKLFGA